jgi:hypothetical protein
MNATVHSRAPAAPVIWVHVASDRDPVATESPPHWFVSGDPSKLLREYLQDRR